MNVRTGEVLAIASYPDYNPQSFTDGISKEEWIVTIIILHIHY